MKKKTTRLRYGVMMMEKMSTKYRNSKQKVEDGNNS